MKPHPQTCQPSRAATQGHDANAAFWNLINLQSEMLGKHCVQSLSRTVVLLYRSIILMNSCIAVQSQYAKRLATALLTHKGATLTLDTPSH
jgi:hypothetical protein